MLKNFILVSLLLTISLSLIGCMQTTSLSDNSSVKEDMKEFIEPEPSDWVTFIKPVREYMYYRTQAVLYNDIQILWNQYEELSTDIDQTNGINVEKFEVETLNKSFELFDANYDIESYEQIKIKKNNDYEAVVLVHGSISYLRHDFEESGGEYLIKLFLENKENHWKVVKTDEYTLPEYKEWVEEMSSKK